MWAGIPKKKKTIVVLENTQFSKSTNLVVVRGNCFETQYEKVEKDVYYKYKKSRVRRVPRLRASFEITLVP